MICRYWHVIVSSPYTLVGRCYLLFAFFVLSLLLQFGTPTELCFTSAPLRGCVKSTHSRIKSIHSSRKVLLIFTLALAIFYTCKYTVTRSSPHFFILFCTSELVYITFKLRNTYCKWWCAYENMWTSFFVQCHGCELKEGCDVPRTSLKHVKSLLQVYCKKIRNRAPFCHNHVCTEALHALGIFLSCPYDVSPPHAAVSYALLRVSRR